MKPHDKVVLKAVRDWLYDNKPPKNYIPLAAAGRLDTLMLNYCLQNKRYPSINEWVLIHGFIPNGYERLEDFGFGPIESFDGLAARHGIKPRELHMHEKDVLEFACPAFRTAKDLGVNPYQAAHENGQ